MSIIRTSHNKERPYVVLDKGGLEDQNLSWGAKGLWAYLIGKPDNWVVCVSHLAGIYTKRGGGEKAIYTYLNELIEFGYCERTQQKDDKGQFCKYEYVVLEFKKCLPHRLQRDAVERHAVKDGLLYIDSNNNEETTTKESPGRNEQKNSSSFSGKKIDELEALELTDSQKNKIYTTFPEERILKGLAWLKNTEGIRDIGAALYNAIQEGFEAKKTKQQIEKENKDYVKEKFGIYDDKDFRGIRISICNKYIDFGGRIIEYESGNFLNEIKDIEKKLNLS